MGGGYSPLYKEPFVTLIGNDVYGYFAVYISGGTVKVIGNWASDGTAVFSYVLYKHSLSEPLVWVDFSTANADTEGFFNQISGLYGFISAEKVEFTPAIIVNGKQFALDNIVYDDVAELFNRVGLCEGITAVRNAVDDEVIACGVYCNGLFHLFGIVDGDGIEKAACDIGLYSDISDFPSLRETLLEPSTYWSGDEYGADRYTVNQLLTSRGINVVWHSLARSERGFISSHLLYLTVTDTDIYK